MDKFILYLILEPGKFLYYVSCTEFGAKFTTNLDDAFPFSDRTCAESMQGMLKKLTDYDIKLAKLKDLKKEVQNG